MSNLFQSAHNRVRNSPMVLLVFLSMAVLCWISIVLLREAVNTNLAGYLQLPTRKIDPGVSLAVALLPLAAEVGLTFAFLQDSRKRWALLLTFIFHNVDMYLDVLYKAGGSSDPAVWIIAFFESEFLFTLGAVFFFTFSVGMLFEILPDVITQAGILVYRIGGATLSLHGDDAPARPDSYNPVRTDKPPTPMPPTTQKPVGGSDRNNPNFRVHGRR